MAGTTASIVKLLAICSLLAACGSPGRAGSGSSTAPTAASAVPADFPLLGSWTVDITKDDLEAGGISDPLVRNENSGRFTWTFSSDGTWTEVQESLDGSPVVNPIFRGTFRVNGATMTATTTFPDAYKDTGLHYTWTVAGDEARLDLLDPPDPILPLIVETHPWKRAG
jgi:hypothetical protein